MTEIICDRCRDDVGKRAALVLHAARPATADKPSTQQPLDFCVACSQDFDKWLRKEPV